MPEYRGNVKGVNYPVADTSKIYGNNLSNILKERKISKLELANRIGVSYQTVHRLCNGTTTGYLDTWVRICNELGVSLDDVFRR